VAELTPTIGGVPLASSEWPHDARRARRLATLLLAWLCFEGAATTIAGLLATTLFGIWWLDPLVALAIARLAVSEGRSAWRGESCGYASCATGILE
jgi:hypothetical protein